MDTIETDTVVSQLNDIGHSVTSDSLLNMLNGHEMVQTATKHKIDLAASSTPSASGGEDAQERNREVVRQLAKKQIERGIE